MNERWRGSSTTMIVFTGLPASRNDVASCRTPARLVRSVTPTRSRSRDGTRMSPPSIVGVRRCGSSARLHEIGPAAGVAEERVIAEDVLRQQRLAPPRLRGHAADHDAVADDDLRIAHEKVVRHGKQVEGRQFALAVAFVRDAADQRLREDRRRPVEKLRGQLAAENAAPAPCRG